MCNAGTKPYHLELTGDRTEIRYVVNDTIFLTNLPAGNYYVKAIDGNGCEGQEYSFAQTVLSTLNDKATENPFIIYPNPATNHIQVSGIHNIAAITIYSIEGQKIYEGSFSNQQFINLPDLMPALYFIQVEEESKRNIFKLMIK